MKNPLFTTILLFASLVVCAQIRGDNLDKKIRPLMKKVKMLHSENRKLRLEIEVLNSKLATATNNVDNLQIKSLDNSEAITQTANELELQIKKTDNKNDGKITEVANSLSKNSNYGIIGLLVIILFSGLLLYSLLCRRQKLDKTDLEAQLSQIKKSIEKEQVLVNTQLTELYGQMELLNIARMHNPNNSLKVAEEIVKMEMKFLLWKIRLAVTNNF